MELLILFLVFLLAFTTMFLGAISGGVGLVMRPLLLLLGIPPSIVIGSSRASGPVGDLPGIYVLYKKKKIDWQFVKKMILPLFFGSLISSILVLYIPAKALEVLIGFLLLIAGIALIYQGKVSKEKGKAYKPTAVRSVFGIVGTSVVGFVNIIVGGVVPMLASLYIIDYKKSYLDASIASKVISYIASNLVIVVFVFGNTIDWQLAAALTAGYALGNFFGVRYALKKGEAWIKPLVLVVVFASAIKFIFFP